MRTDRKHTAETASFKMGAVVAIGELYDEGALAAEPAISMLGAFGVRSQKDLLDLGIRHEAYLADFKVLLQAD